MDLNAILRLVGANLSEDRNGFRRPGIYSPSRTDYTTYDSPNSAEDGWVHPIMPNTAHINTAGNRDDDVHNAYVVFHEAAHTAQPVAALLSKLLDNRVGDYSKLRSNKFDYYGTGGNVPPAEALASLRGMEAMMPEGKNIWNYGPDSLHDDKQFQPSLQYLLETVQNNPGMSVRGAQRLIDTRMFPDHQLMHDPGNERLTPFDEGIMDKLMRYLK